MKKRAKSYAIHARVYFCRNKPVPLVLDSEGKSDIPTATRAPTLMVSSLILYIIV